MHSNNVWILKQVLFTRFEWFHQSKLLCVPVKLMRSTTIDWNQLLYRCDKNERKMKQNLILSMSELASIIRRTTQIDIYSLENAFRHSQSEISMWHFAVNGLRIEMQNRKSHATQLENASKCTVKIDYVVACWNESQNWDLIAFSKPYSCSEWI